MTISKGTLFVVTAPSGAGKTTLVDALLKKVEKSHNLKRVVTYTSRKPRSHEIPGKDYHFLDPQDFERQICAGFFLEWSTVYGTYYGSAATLLEQLQQGTSLIIILDIQGALALKQIYEQVVLIWIAPVNMETLRNRLVHRATDSSEQVNFRLALAESEIKNHAMQASYDYTIINDDFNRALIDLIDIVTQKLHA